MNALLALFAVLAALILCEEPLSQPRLLTLSSARELRVPPFGFSGEPQCDAAGNLFFHLDSGRYNDSIVLKMSADGQRSTLYRLSDEWLEKTAFVAFAVSPGGETRILAEARDGLYVFDFGSNAEMKSPTRLHVPDNFVARRFATFADEAMLVSGYFGDKAPEAIRGQTYAAIHDASGALRKALDQPLPGIDLASVHKALPDGGGALGEDGNAYFVQGERLLVMSSLGEVVRSISFQKPSPAAAASRIHVSGGLAAIVFSSMDSDPRNRRLKREFLVLDADSGNVIGLYHPTQELGMDVCFARGSGFIFLHRERRGEALTLKRAELR